MVHAMPESQCVGVSLYFKKVLYGTEMAVNSIKS